MGECTNSFVKQNDLIQFIERVQVNDLRLQVVQHDSSGEPPGLVLNQQNVSFLIHRSFLNVIVTS